jgi:hypothetical protein
LVRRQKLHYCKIRKSGTTALENVWA